MADEHKIILDGDSSGAVNAVNKLNRSLATLNPAARSASSALLGVNRVVQDLPFGFAAIGNNLEELPRAFGALSAAAKESGQSIGKVLLSSLTGAGGIGLALSAVTTAITFMTNGFGPWTRGFGGASKAAKEAADATEKFEKSIKGVGEIMDEAQSSVQGNIATVQALGRVITDTNKPYADRKRALEELKETNKSYFGDLTLEEAKMGLLSKRIQEYTQALIQQAVVKKFSDAIADTALAIATQEKEVEKARTSLAQFNKELEKQQKIGAERGPKRAAFFAGEDVNNANKINDALRNATEAKQRFNEESEKLTRLEEQRIHDNNQLNSAVEKQVTLRKLESGHVDKIKKDVESVSHAHILDQSELAKAQELSDIIHGILPQKKTAVTPTGPILPSITFPQQTLDTAQERIEEFATQVDKIFKGMVSNAIETAATAIGEAFAGGGLKSALGGFVSIIATALQTIGKIAIETGLAVESIKKALRALISNPALLVAAGAAAIAVGAAIKAKIPKFAEGGIATKPTLGIFGEAGPEALIPLNKMHSMGSGMPAVVELRLRGRDAVGLIEINKRSLNRIT